MAEEKTLHTRLEYEAPTWNRIYKMLISQAKKIRESGFQPDVILGVSRGGWIPARILSDLLENPNLANVRVEFYVDVAKTRNAPLLTQGTSADVAGKRVLVVDDVSDTGKSLRLVKDHVLKQGAKELKVATLYRKPWSMLKPDYCERETKAWVVFPWERKETIRRIREKHGSTGLEEATAKLVKAGFPKSLADRILKETSEEKTC
jgi:hypoxanthine phosphoribosyltransferase